MKKKEEIDLLNCDFDDVKDLDQLGDIASANTKEISLLRKKISELENTPENELHRESLGRELKKRSNRSFKLRKKRDELHLEKRKAILNQKLQDESAGLVDSLEKARQDLLDLSEKTHNQICLMKQQYKKADNREILARLGRWETNFIHILNLLDSLKNLKINSGDE